MAFTVLSDSDIKSLFSNLKPTDVEGLAQDLIEALIQYSCQNEGQYQPHRAHVTRSDGQVSLFMPATTPQNIGVKIVGVAPSEEPKERRPGTKPKPGLQSVLTICDAFGQAVGVMNAAELTAFRTSLGSILLYRLRKITTNIVVFGAGKQALWHIRLALILRGKDIHKITVVNRSTQRTNELMQNLRASGVPSHVDLSAYDAAKSGVEELVTSADVIFCTTPSTAPLFPASYLTSDKARAKTRYISAIGSYRLDMQEIDPGLLRTITSSEGVFSSQIYQGCISVDSVKGCLDEAGELVAAGIRPDQMLEVGKVEEMRRKGSPDGFDAWLESGFVVYKSVGIGIMDIAIGNSLLKLAKAKNIGVHLDNF